MEKDERIRQIADYYGYESQSNQLIEEMGELMQALNKFRRLIVQKMGVKVNPVKLTLRETLDNIAEEIADVTICLEQVVVLTGLESEIARIREIKIQRQLQRMKENEV